MSRRTAFHGFVLPRRARALPQSAGSARGPSTELARQLLLKRAVKRDAVRSSGRRCVYCGTSVDLATATLDHVQPVAHGGASEFGNLVAACAPCNRLKGDLLPHEFFVRYPWAGINFVRYARTVHRALKRGARRAVSLAMAA
jgi:5-methylcytosine-specific restriction endonuclease McrA